MQLISELTIRQWEKEVLPRLQDNFLNMETGNYTPRTQRAEAARQVHSTFKDGVYTIYGPEWAFTYEYGRGPTINPGNGAVRRNVLQYLTEENIKSRGDHDLETVAFFISRQIHEEGSWLFRKKQQSGVISQVLNAQSLATLQAQISESLLQATSSFLLTGITTK
jgi:hypothetical protein